MKIHKQRETDTDKLIDNKQTHTIEQKKNTQNKLNNTSNTPEGNE